MGRLGEAETCLGIMIYDSNIKQDASPFVDAFLAEAVCAGQDEVSLPVHTDAALLLIGQLLHPAQERIQSKL